MRIVVIGCGRTGGRLVRVLASAGHAVAAVDVDPAAFDRIGPLPGVERIVGVGFDREVLAAAGVADADGLAAVTGSDEANAVVGRLAVEVFAVPRVVARLYDPAKAEIYRRLGLQVVAPVTWGVQRLADILSFSRIGEVASLGTGEVDLVEVAVPRPLAGRPARDVTIPGEVALVAVSRSGRTFIPSAESPLAEGDLIHLAVLGTSRARVEAILGMAL